MTSSPWERTSLIFEINKVVYVESDNSIFLVPIGAWCRTAYQVSEFLKKRGYASVSYPFDWTITPFSALEVLMQDVFTPEDVLKTHNMRRSVFDSVVDDYTTLIHHHDFPPLRVREFDANSPRNERGLPTALYETYLVNKARDRFAHTWGYFEQLKQIKNKILFVRWQKRGHPEGQLPSLLEGESIDSLAGVIKGYLKHENFSILLVKSDFQDVLPEETILEYKREEFGVFVTIAERLGFDGDGTTNFKGDTVSWDSVLNRFVSDEYGIRS